MYFLAQISEHLWRGWAFLTTGRVLAVVLGVGFALLAITLFIASRTRWGQAKPLTKCVVLSILAHVWLLMYALGTRPVLPQGDPNGSHNVTVALTHDLLDAPPAREVAQEPESEIARRSAWEEPVPLDELPIPPLLAEILAASELKSPELFSELTPMPALPAPAEAPLAEIAPPAESLPAPSSLAFEEPPGAEVAEQVPQVLPSSSAIDSATQSDVPPELVPMHTVAAQDIIAPQPILPPNVSQLPPEYQLRQAANRLEIARAYGADEDSEAAVNAGLQWLASAQAHDGSWIASQHGGGTETYALGENRHGTGDRADTGISGLALLAFLSAGHTHLHGDHQATVGRGLAFLIRAQMPSGDLSGPKQVGNGKGVTNARMYCHSIAALALAEAYAMTFDVALREALVKAAGYSIAAQDSRGGGWRYRPGDPGDLSQFGWQAMVLRSVETSGIPVPAQVQQRMRSFLDSCAAGTARGLATYRPREGRPTSTMTAEALACRLLMDYPLTAAARREATSMILRDLPGSTEDNAYFWYYATLALFQLQDENWRVWNQALKQHLLAIQVPAYRSEPGSWTPDSVWGGYGGRVYSTAMCCLCLEVYYRYLPLYQRSNVARQFDQPTQPIFR